MDFSQIPTYLNDHRATLLTILFGALTMSVTLEVYLTKFQIESKKVAFTMLHAMTAVTGLVTLYLGATGKDAAGTFAGLTIVAGFWHQFIVSPFNTKYVTPFLNWMSAGAPLPPKPAVPAAQTTDSTLSAPANAVAAPTLGAK